MRSYQIVEPGKPLEARELDTPAPQGSEVLLSVEACGVCHSDLHLWDGYFDLGDGRKAEVAGRSFPLPFTLGHEAVGTVEAVGPEAEGVEPGDRRAIYPWVGCGECRVCRAGDEHVCEKPRAIGINVAGGYSDHLLVPHPRYLVDFGSVPDALAGTYACSGVTAYSALKKAAPLVEKDDWLLIVGAGGVGLNAVHIARNVVEGRIVVADIDPAKRDAAKAAGADEVVDNSDPAARKALRQITGGPGASAAIDFVGAPASAQFGLGGLRKNGTLIVVGLYGGSMPLSLALLPLQNYTVRGSYVGSLAEFRELIELAKAGKIPALEVSERPLSEANAALEALRNGEILGRLVLRP